MHVRRYRYLRAESTPDSAWITLGAWACAGTVPAGAGDEIVAALSSASRDPERPVVVLRVDAEAAEPEPLPTGGARTPEPRASAPPELMAALERCGRTTIAGVTGRVEGVWAQLALACDVVVATASTVFAFAPRAAEPELAPPWTGDLAAHVGLARAKDLLFTGRDLGANEARALGLVTRVCPDVAFDHALSGCISEVVDAGMRATRPSSTTTVMDEVGEGDGPDDATEREQHARGMIAWRYR